MSLRDSQPLPDVGVKRGGYLEEAIEAAKKMVEISPNDPFSHTALSRLYVQKGMIEEAEKEMAISHQLAQQ